MKLRPKCFTCTLRKAREIGRRSTEDEGLRDEIMNETLKWLANHYTHSEIPPSIPHTKVCQISRKVTGERDPFSSVKKTANELALKILPELRKKIRERKGFKNAFKLAVKATVQGNVIDVGAREDVGVEKEVVPRNFLNRLEEELSIDDTDEAMKHLSDSDETLYLLDNAGEAVFDKLLIEIISEEYPCKITAAVKGGPVLNDVTAEDAEEVGLREVASVITTGDDYVGVHLESASEEFLNHLESADFIIAKGQGHYESLTEINPDAPICYILKAKCIEVARDLGVPVQGNVVKVT